ncbi:hypothetical protein C172_08929 [Paenibacillus sp. FSL H8-457]|nr:hypothetical protein C172_08929 [Paenibacillus sp. FSL H8-457]
MKDSPFATCIVQADIVKTSECAFRWLIHRHNNILSINNQHKFCVVYKSLAKKALPALDHALEVPSNLMIITGMCLFSGSTLLTLFKGLNRDIMDRGIY